MAQCPSWQAATPTNDDDGNNLPNINRSERSGSDDDVVELPIAGGYFASPALPTPGGASPMNNLTRAAIFNPDTRKKSPPMSRAGSIITQRNRNVPLAAAVDVEQEDDDREFWEVKAVLDHGWIRNSLFHQVEWSCNQQTSWEPLHHLNCFPLVMEMYARCSNASMARAIEIYHNMQPVNLRMHIKDSKFLLKTRLKMLDNAWMARSFVHDRFDPSEAAERVADFNDELNDVLRCKIRVVGGFEFQVMNTVDGRLPPMPYGRTLDEAPELANPVPRPDFARLVPSPTLLHWGLHELNSTSNPHRMSLHAPGGGVPPAHSFILTLVYRNRFAEWQLRPTRDLRPGIRLMRVEGEVVDDLHAEKYMRRDACEVLCFVNFIHLREGKSLDRRKHFDYSRFIAQSCTPNCEIRVRGKGKQQAVYLYSKGQIKNGEKLTIDYFPTAKKRTEQPMLRADFIECMCGVVSCRGVLWMEEKYLSLPKIARLKKRAPVYGLELLK